MISKYQTSMPDYGGLVKLTTNKIHNPSRTYQLTKFQEKEEKIMHPRYLILTMMVGSSMGKEDGLAHNRIVIPKYSKDEINIKKKNIIL